MIWRGHRLEEEEALATAQRQLGAERELAGVLAGVLHSVDAAVLAVDARLRRIFSNPVADGLLPSLQRLPQLVQWVEGVLESGEAWNARLPLPDERTLDVHLTPMTTPAGAACVIAARDITATVRLETARKDFIASISHELRTPLTSIQGYAEMLQQGERLPEKTREEYLDAVVQNTARLARLARDLVTLSSVETGTYPFRFEVLEGASLVEPVLQVLAPQARELGSELRMGAMAPGRIRADRDAMHRVLLNLAENALLHGGAGVEVEIAAGPADGGFQYQVRDNGVGIGSSDQPRVFERFYRVVRQGQASTGLGLALVKHIVLEHGGQVELQSALGQGSTFTIRLPLQ